MSPIPNKPMPINPFKLKAALKRLDDLGIVVGKNVTVTWTIPANYATEGGTTRSHTGPLAYLDRERGFYEIKPSNRSPGHYRGYLMAETSVLSPATEEVQAVPVNINKGNPFIDKAKPPTPAKKQPQVNPFLNPKPRLVKRDHGKQVNPFLKGK